MTENKKIDIQVQRYIDHAEALRRAKKKKFGTELKKVRFDDGVVLERIHNHWYVVAIVGIIDDVAKSS